MDTTKGLIEKYRIFKSDGRPVDPSGKYFVLKINSKDKHHAECCQYALQQYATGIRKINPKLADDLLKWIKEEWQKSSQQ